MKRSTIVLLSALGAALLFLLLSVVVMGRQAQRLLEGKGNPVAAVQWRAPAAVGPGAYGASGSGRPFGEL